MNEGNRSDRRWYGVTVASGGSIALHVLFLLGFVAAAQIRIESLAAPRMKPPAMLEFKLPAAAAAAASGAPPPRGRQAVDPAPARRPAPEHVQPPDPEPPPGPAGPVNDPDTVGVDEGLDEGAGDGAGEGERGGGRDGVPWGDPDGVVGGMETDHGHPAPGDDEPLHLTGEVRPPERFVFVKPEYPEVARKARVAGKVILQIVVGKTGEVEQVTVLRSDPLFDRTAIEAVGKWRYRPALQGGRPVKVYMTVIVEFGLN